MPNTAVTTTNTATTTLSQQHKTTLKQDRRVRFPEFVYAFFEPPRGLLAESDAETRHALAKQADDNRWALYYGVKVHCSNCMHTLLLHSRVFSSAVL
jgi:hypothetical protein